MIIWSSNPTFLLLGIYPKDIKSPSKRNIFTPMFTAALFTVANIWKHSKWLSTDEWIKKMWALSLSLSRSLFLSLSLSHCLSLYIYIHVYTYINVYIYTHTHTYTQNGILFSNKKKENLPFLTTWVKLEDTMLSEIS